MKIAIPPSSVALLLCSYAAALSGQTWVFTDVTAINPRRGKSEPHINVVVQNTKITAVQPVSASLPRGARRINGRGKFLIPGLWDAHVHLTKTGTLSLPLFVANGVTGVRDMGSDYQEVSAWRAAIQEGTIVGPRIFTSGQILESSANIARMKREGTVEPVDRIRIGVANPDEGRAAVARLAAQGVDHIKMRTTPDLETFRAVADEAMRRNLPFAAHPSGTPQNMISAGLRSVEHFLAFPPLDALSQAQRRALFEEMARSGMFYSNTMVNVDTLLLSYEEAKRRVEDASGKLDPRRKYVCGYLVEDWREQVEESKGAPYEIIKRQLPGLYRDFREMREAGVQFLAGTDVGVLLLYPGFSMHDELEKLVQDAGFSPMEALRVATAGPAAYFHREMDFGSLEPGQAADLVLLDADPLANTRNTRRIAGVMLNGRWLNRSALDNLLREVERDAQSGCRRR